MLLWPILRREIRAGARRREHFVLRTVMALAAGTTVVVIGCGTLGERVFTQDVFNPAGLFNYGLGVLCALGVTEVLLLCFLVPSVVGGAIAEERERSTLTPLLLSRLTRSEIVLMKLVGRSLPALSLALTGVPFVALGAYLAGLFPRMAVVVSAGLLSTSLAAGGLSLFCSALNPKVGNAKASAILLTWVWLIVPTFLALLPRSARPGWAELSLVTRSIGELIGPTSPLWLVTIVRTGPGSGRADDIESLILQMCAGQFVLLLVAFTGAVWMLRREEPRGPSANVLELRRPPCGEDPIFWREFDLPNRTGSLPRPLLLLAQLAILVRLLLRLVLQTVGVLILLAIPTALIFGTISLAVPAFREAWLRPGSSHVARDELRLLITGVSLFVGGICLLGGTATAAGRITTERDRSTWIPLLTTPLEGRELLLGKMWATAVGHWRLVRVLVPLWLVGLACDALNPLGAALGGAALLAAGWLGIALGTWLGVRAETGTAATSTPAFGALGLVVLNMPHLLICLYSGMSPSGLREAGPLQMAAVITYLVAAPLGNAALAWWLTRRTFERFDVYVDRPRRASG